MKKYRYDPKTVSLQRIKNIAVLFVAWNFAGFCILKFATRNKHKKDDEERGFFTLPKEDIINLRGSEEGIRHVKIKGFTVVEDREYSSTKELSEAKKKKMQQNGLC